jgi:GNAT superfamily N-acetyltransferase
VQDRDQRESEDLAEAGAADPAWVIEVATQLDVGPAVEHFSDHMNDRQRAAFRDKLERYVRKPDRDLIVALQDDRILGLICVIDRSILPSSFSDEEKAHLQEYASITQLFVHTTMRRKGIGGSLYLRAEQWARERGRPGLWLVTHQMGEWYRRHFNYEEIGRIGVKSTEKSVMAKTLV